MNTIDELRTLFETHFQRPLPDFARETTAKDVTGWDSVAHLTLLMDAETRFGVTFSADELDSFDNVGGVVDAIDAHRRARATAGG